MVNAAVVVDPTTKRVISSACDQVRGCTIPKSYANTETNPTKFGKLLDIGKHQKKLASLSSCDSEHFVSCLHPLRWTEQQQLIGLGSWHPLQHAAMVAIESSAARDRLLFPSDGHCPSEFDQEDRNLSLGTDLPSKRQKTHLSRVSLLFFLYMNCHFITMLQTAVSDYIEEITRFVSFRPRMMMRLSTPKSIVSVQIQLSHTCVLVMISTLSGSLAQCKFPWL